MINRQETSFASAAVRLPILASSLALGLGVATTADAAPVDAEPKTVEPEKPSSLIIVTGAREDSVQLDRIATPIVDTPQAITSISVETLADRGISNLNDALRNVAGISIGAGETSFQGNNAVLRGFTTRNDLFLDNSRDYGYYFRDTFDDSSIEVLKGPSSILFGRGSTGGVIHRVSKTPEQETFGEVELRVGLEDTRRISVDVNIADALGDGSAFRINSYYHESAVEDRDIGKSNRWGVAPKMAFDIGDATKVILSYLHQEERNVPDYGIPWFPGTQANPGAPANVRRANFYGFTNDFFDTNVNILTAKLDHEVSESVRIRSQARYSYNTRRFRYSEAIIPVGTSRTTPLSAITVSRNLFEGSSVDEFVQNQTDVEARFAVGGTNHILIAGFELGQESSAPVYFTNTNVPATSLTAPTNPFYNSPGNRFVRLRAQSRSTAVGFFAIDTIDLGERWRAVIGARWDSFRTKYDSQGFNSAATQIATTNVDRTDRNLSYRGAVIYKPAKNGSIYAAYANSFNPSGEGIESLISAGRSVAQANINLAPETSFSVELGTKWQLFGGKSLLSASLFRIQKNNVRVPDPTTPGFNALGGKQRVDGGEVEFNGEVASGLNLGASYAYLDSQTLESSPAGPVVGAGLTLTARHMGTINASYDVTRRFNLGLNLVSTSKRLGQNTPSSFLIAPSYTILDLSLKYRLTDKIVGTIIVNNLTDKLYYEQLHPVHVIPGAGRSALATIRIGL